MNADHAIEVKGLQKSFQSVSVLKDVTFSIQKGTIFSLLGSNGAGKTTTIKILSTLVQADQGELSICGCDVLQEPERIHEVISLTGQFAALDDMLTGLENLVLMGKLHGLKHPKQRAEELLSYFQLSEGKDRLVSTYSGGMRRKLDIAMSLVHNPAVLFLDEPTTGLDPQSRHSMWEIICDLKKQGTTIFLTTQYLEEAEELADHIAILDQGKILVQGTLEDLKQCLPQEILSFTFSTKQDYERANTLLSDHQMIKDESQNQISVYSCEAVNALTQLFQLFLTHHIEIKDVVRKTPSLEDVFLTLIGEKENNSHAKHHSALS